MRSIATIMLLAAACGVFCIRVGCAAPPLPPKVLIEPKRYHVAKIQKQSAELIERAVVPTSPMIAIGITVYAHHEIQVSTNLMDWQTVTNYDEPTVWHSFPATGISASYRDKETFTNGAQPSIVLSTNANTP